jgi:hypothetical protein
MIRDVYPESRFVRFIVNWSESWIIFPQCCGSGMFIPDPGLNRHRVQIQIRKIDYFTPTNFNNLSKTLSGMFIPDPGLVVLLSIGLNPGSYFLSVADAGCLSRIQG